jgi:hypothetical protein
MSLEATEREPGEVRSDLEPRISALAGELEERNRQVASLREEIASVGRSGLRGLRVPTYCGLGQHVGTPDFACFAAHGRACTNTLPTLRRRPHGRPTCGSGPS